ncbi:MAG TPA: AAA family ATPase [Pyrinomonadaceae bacterium]|nr:AAA family ATPase [Pyrinomonadaceae bacterium]
MYIRKVRIKNIRGIDLLDWSVSPRKEAGWHVIIGDNGAGKSTVLRSIALALVGPKEAIALRQNWNDWLTRGKSSGEIRLTLNYNVKLDKFTGSGNIPDRLLPVQVSFTRQNGEVELRKGMGINADRHVWGNKSGWFSASYGPFRRFAGGDKDADRIFLSNPKLASHLSVFGENIALTESLAWLRELKFKKLEEGPEGKLLDSLKAFVNQPDFLPHKARLKEVSSSGVEFIDGNDRELLVEDLSDGYRSILSMTFELIRQLSRAYAPSYIFNEDRTRIMAPGVVLIDEIDAHLHPSWQRKIGIWLREHFPRMQFIVTTHSPLICQAADVGSVWRLPRPGTEETGQMLTGMEFDRLVYGNVLDAYSTEAFGGNINRSDESKKRLQRLAELNFKELHSQLTQGEIREQDKLRATLPTSAHSLKLRITQ